MSVPAFGVCFHREQPAAVRNPVATAMEIATLAWLERGRHVTLEHAPVGLRMLRFYPDLQAKAVASSWQEAIATMPVDWWSDLGPIGAPDDAVAYLAVMSDAGADALALFPDPDDPVADAQSFAEQVLTDVR